MQEYIREIEKIAAKYTESQSDGYSQIMRICDAMREQQKSTVIASTERVCFSSNDAFSYC